MGYDPADGRNWNSSHFVKGSHAAATTFEMAKDDLIHDAQLIERSVAAELFCQQKVQATRESDHGLRRYIVRFISHILLSVTRISR